LAQAGRLKEKVKPAMKQQKFAILFLSLVMITIALTACGVLSPPPPTETSLPPTETPDPPTETPDPPTDTPPPPTAALSPAEQGALSFVSRECDNCHTLDGTVALGYNQGPSLQGIGAIAKDRVPGLSVEEYLRQSIIDPNAYITEGFSKDIMIGIYGNVLSDEEIDAIIAFLLTQ
jgi:hypothetical protein